MNSSQCSVETETCYSNTSSLWSKDKPPQAQQIKKNAPPRRRNADGHVGASRRRSHSTEPSSAVSREQEASEGQEAAASVAAHERLYQAAERVRERRAEEIAKKAEAETVGCTFQPAVIHRGHVAVAAAAAAATTAGRTR